MRISTSQIYSSGALGIQRNQSELVKLQNQLSSGRRIVSPEDDPVAAAQALVVTQSKEVNAQYLENQGSASAQLGFLDNQLTALTGLLHNVRERVVQAGNTTLNNSDRQSIATELQSRLEEMMGLANSQNGAGEYLFSGYQGGVRPFALNAAGVVAYSGDDGARLLQVSQSRQMQISVDGNDLFMNAKGGNGSFVASAGGNVGGGVNLGSAVVDAGSVLDPQKWASGLNGYPWSSPTSPALQIRFAVVGPVRTYQLYDVSVPGTPVALTAAAPYTPGQAIPIETTTPPPTDFGSQVVVSGLPADGDTIAITPSAHQSLFKTMQSVLATLGSSTAGGTYTTTQYTNEIAAQLTNLDQALDNVSRVQSTIGAQMRELDSLGSTASAADLQFRESLSDLHDHDYAKAISDFTRQQVNLEAAQKSFVQISQLSLFNYL